MPFSFFVAWKREDFHKALYFKGFLSCINIVEDITFFFISYLFLGQSLA